MQIINIKKGKSKWIGSAGILLVTVMSFWTQYFGLFFILPLALVTVIMLVKGKRIQELWAYIRTMATAAGIGVCIYPFAIGDVLFSERGTEALSQWQNGFADYINRLIAFGKVLADNVAGNTVVFVAILLIPVAVTVVNILCKKEKTEGLCWNVVILCLVPTMVYFLLAAKMSPYFVDRYIMAIFPMTAVVVMLLWDRMCVCLTKKHMAMLLGGTMVLFVMVTQLVSLRDGHTYLYKGYEEQLQVSEDYAEYPVVCYYDGYGFYENVMEMERYKQTMLVKASELSAMDEERIQVTRNGYVALIKYPGDEAGKAQLAQVMDVFGGSSAKLIYEGGAFGDAIYLVTP